jgi:hypothetical protein
MKRLALAGGLALALTLAALAANITPTPIVPPNETGENSASSQQVVDMARFKLGFCTATATGSGAAAGAETATCNGAWAQVTTVSLTLNTVGALNTLTITDNKVNVGDGCMASVDATGAAAGSTIEAMNCSVTAANTIVVVIISNSTTSPAAPVKVNVLIGTSGNPN